MSYEPNIGTDCHHQACIKPQYVDQIPKAVKGTVQAMLDRKDELSVQQRICDAFGEVMWLLWQDLASWQHGVAMETMTGCFLVHVTCMLLGTKLL